MSTVVWRLCVINYELCAKEIRPKERRIDKKCKTLL